MKKVPLIILLLFYFLATVNTKSYAQKPEIGFSIILCGAIMFGPYFGYWIDDHQCIRASTLAAWEEELVFPFAMNIGYVYYFGDKRWRPKAGLQYSLLLAPSKSRSPDKPRSLSLISFLPGVQYRWDNTHQSVEGQFWIAYFLKDKKVRPIALECTYGYKY